MRNLVALFAVLLSIASMAQAPQASPASLTNAQKTAITQAYQALIANNAAISAALEREKAAQQELAAAREARLEKSRALSKAKADAMRDQNIDSLQFAIDNEGNVVPRKQGTANPN